MAFQKHLSQNFESSYSKFIHPSAQKRKFYEPCHKLTGFLRCPISNSDVTCKFLSSNHMQQEPMNFVRNYTNIFNNLRYVVDLQQIYTG